MTKPHRPLAGVHLTGRGIVVAAEGEIRRHVHDKHLTSEDLAGLVSALIAADCAGRTCVVAVPADWPLPAWFVLQHHAQAAGVGGLRIISDLAAAGLAYGVREKTKRFQVMDATAGLGARFRWEDGVCELRRLGRMTEMTQKSYPGVCFGGDMPVFPREDDLPAQGALLQAQVLTGAIDNVLLLDGSACSWQVRTPGVGWDTLVGLGQSIPVRRCRKMAKGTKRLRLRAVGPGGGVWLQHVLALPGDTQSRKTLEINVDAGQEVTVRILDRRGKELVASLLAGSLQDAERKSLRLPQRRSQILTPEEINTMMLGLDEDASDACKAQAGGFGGECAPR
ncbi:MAG: hypothetical protein H7836_13590 [Magnetococcus sp. YQC-3]